MDEIMFVCSGNTCRSPMAEAIFNHKNIPGYTSISRGIFVVKGSILSDNAFNILKNEIFMDMNNREAVQIKDTDIDKVKYIFTMTKNIEKILKNEYPNQKEKIFSIKEFVYGNNNDVIDPYGMNVDYYMETYKELNNIIRDLIKKI